MYSLTKPLSTVALSMDAIRLKSFEEKVDAVSGPDLASGNRDEPDGKVVDSTPDLVLILKSSWRFRELTDGRTSSQAGFDRVGCF